MPSFYAPAAVTPSSIGAQPLDADLTAVAALGPTAGLVEVTGEDTYAVRALGVGAATSVPTRADADARYQALDPDLTAVAGVDSGAANAGKAVGVLTGGGLGLIAVAALLASPAVVEGVSWQELFVEGYGPDLNTPPVVETPTWSA